MARSLVMADASALINLEASQIMAEIVDVCEYELGVVHPSVWREALYVRRPSTPDPVRELIDLDAHEREGRVRRLTLEAVETGLYVHFAIQMDDGEAAGLAVAVARGLEILADDRAVTRVIRLESLAVQQITTPAILRRWANAITAPGRVSEILRNIQAYGNYVPPASDPEYPWWVKSR